MNCNKTEIIAEISANHNGSLQRAKKTILEAAKAGASAIKLQTYTADTMTLNLNTSYFRINGTIWDGKTLYDLYKEACTPWEWTLELIELAKQNGLDCFSTPFDNTAVDFLEKCGVSRYKIASFELIDIPLLKKIASTKKPVILSTGMASLAEIDEAVQTLRKNGSGELTLLKCTSAYPAPPDEANLATIPHLAQTFKCKVGLSDHTLDTAVAITAVALGACMIEKHFTLCRADGGPDASFSIEPAELKNLVKDIQTAEKAIGNINYDLTCKEKESVIFRRSLFAVQDIKAGEKFTLNNIRAIRPGHGLHPRFLEIFLNKKARHSIPKGTPLSWSNILEE